MGRHVWLIGLCFYGLVACVDFAYHFGHDVRRTDQTIQFSEIPVAFSGALFWPVDVVARSLLEMQ